MEVMNFSILKKGIPNPLKRIKNPQCQAALLALFLSSLTWIITALTLSLIPFGDKTLCVGDANGQYVPFLCEFWSIFHEGGSLLYSFHGGLGNNFYLTFIYYLLSPFTFLVLFFDKTQIPIIANVILILKNILVITIMAWYLASKSEKPRLFLAATLAMAYGFSYYFLTYAHNFMWMDAIALVPLMLYGIERITTRRGRIIYTVSLALAILTNFYMGAVICIFLALYYLVMELKFNKEGLKDFLIFSLCSICAALIAGIVLIPVIKGLLGANASAMEPPSFEIYNDAQYFFSRFLPNASLVMVTPNRGTINLYMGVASFFGFLLFLFAKQRLKHEKYGLLFLLILYLISTQVSFLNYAFHGFYMQKGVPNRYGFIINLLISIGTYYGFSNLSKDSSKKIVLAGFISAWFFGVISAWNSTDSLKLPFILSGLALLYLIVTFYKKTNLISLFVLLESLYGLTMISPATLGYSWIHMEDYIRAIEQVVVTGRMEIVGSKINSNFSMLYGVNGASTFNSIINTNVSTLFKNLGCREGSPYYYFYNGWTPISALFLGVQDIVTNKKVPFPSSYIPILKVDDFTIYEFPYEISFGVIPINGEEIINNKNKFQNLNVIYPNSFSLLEINGSMSPEYEDISEDPYNKKYKVKNLKEKEEVNIQLNPFKSESAYIYSSMNGVELFEIFKNDEKIVSLSEGGSIVYLGSIKITDKVTIKYRSSSEASSQILYIQAATLLDKKTDEAGKYYSSHCLQDQKVMKTTITGTYETSSPENMVFTIPYDGGWTAYVNGKKVSISKWQEAFLSVPLEKGTNEIKLTFFPLGLKEGMIVSFIGLLLAWFLFKKEKSMKLKKEENYD